MAGIPQVITEDRASGAQFIDSSLKFDSSKLQYFTRTPTTAGNRGKWTWSCWCKRGEKIGDASGAALFAAYSSDADRDVIRYGGTATDTLDAQLRDGTNRGIYTTSKFRDTRWYHNVVTYDSAVGVKIYVNGVEQPKTNASGGNATLQTQINNTVEQYIGARKSGGNIEVGWDGHMSQVYFIDGLIKGPEEFGYTDPLTNTWRPKKYEGDFTFVAANELLYGVNTGDNGFDTNATSRTYDATGHSFSTYTSPQTANPGGYGANSAHVYKSPDGAAIDWVVSTSATSRYIWTSSDGNNWSSTGSTYDTATSPQTVNAAWICLCGGANSSYVTVTTSTAGYGPAVNTNSFYLPMDGNTPIGKDQSGRGNDWTPVKFGGSVDLPKATGAIPVLNTNDSGTIAKPGVRTDKKTYTVTASGGKYYLNGALTPTLNAYRGSSLIFDYTGAVSHPLYLSGMPDGKHNSKAYSVEFDGFSGTDLQLTNHTDLQVGSESNWTIEFFVRKTGAFADYDVITGKGGGGQYEWFIEGFANNQVRFLYSADGTTTWTGDHVLLSYMNDNQWYHFAAVRNGTSFKMYVDGIETFSTTGFNIHAGTGALHIGGYGGASAQDPPVQISNYRIVKGTSVYTSNFRRPGTTLENITNTKLLCCHDSSATTATVSPVTITSNGGVSVIQTHQPFLYIDGEGGVNTVDVDTTKITIPHHAADTLYYYCDVHSGMGSSINVTTDIFKADPYAWKCMFAMASDMIDHSPEINVNSTATSFGDIHTTTPQGLRNLYGHSKKMETGGGFRIDMESTTPEADAKHKFDTNDFTLECWFYQDGGNTSWQSLFRSASYNNSTLGSDGIAFYGNGQTLWPYSVISSSGQPFTQSGSVVPYKKWNHAAWTRQGNVNRIFANGVLVVTFNNSDSWNNKGWEIGDVYTWNGGYQDARIYNGVAKYTESFVVPATEPDVLPDTPSGITGKTNLTKITDGGVYINRSSDQYIQAPASTDFRLDGQYCIEYFLKLDDYSNDTVYVRTFVLDGPTGDGGSTNIHLNVNPSTGVLLLWDGSGELISGTISLVGGDWHHVCLTRDSSDETRLFIDGVLSGSTPISTDYNLNSNQNRPRLGALGTTGGTSGFYSNWRIIKGSIPTEYQTSTVTNGTKVFDSPTEALTTTSQGATANDVKLIGCQSPTSATAAAVVPFEVNNNSGTAGAYAPTGLTGGIDFPSGQGTSNHSNGMYLSNASTNFPGNYTIEFWFNVDSLPSDGSGGYGSVFWDGRPPGGGGDSVFGSIYGYNTTGASNSFTIRYHMSGDRISGSTNLSVGTWYHYALVRNNGTVTQYINGTADGSTYSHSTAMISNSDRPYVGGWGYGENGQIPGHDKYALDGKMSNLRMTSTAVYTANFTPPTSNLTAIPGTTFLGLQSTSSATAYTSASGALGGNGNASATNFNPFTDDINAIKGQESGYATINPLYRNPNGAGTLSNGNLTHTTAVGNGQYNATLSIKPNTGKFYWEVTKQTSSNVGMIGITDMELSLSSYNANNVGSFSWYIAGPRKQTAGVDTNYGSGVSENDVVGVAYDSDARELRFYLNGVDQGVAFDSSSIGEADYFPAFSAGSSTTAFTYSVNFGQNPFKFPPPDGFQPLSLSNLQPDKVFARPDQYVGTVLYNGDGGTSNTVTGLTFTPDVVWGKCRTGGTLPHNIFDVVRGFDKQLDVNDTAAEVDRAGDAVTPLSNGFTLDATYCNINNPSTTNVAWCWKAGGNKNTFNIDDVGYANASDVSMNVGALNNVLYDMSDIWSSRITGSVQFGPATNLFDGKITSSVIPQDNGTLTWTPLSAITGTIRIRMEKSGNDLVINGVNVNAPNNTAGHWYTYSGNSITSIQWGRTSSASQVQLIAIEVDGKMLRDSNMVGVPSIAATGCSVGTKQGFSIITYTGDGNTSSGVTISHGLGDTPAFIITKKRSSGTTDAGWSCWHKDIGGNYGIWLHLANARNPSMWSGYSNISSNVFSPPDLNYGNENNQTYVNYLWHDVPGLQKFGKYEGTATADGPFIQCDFKPALVLIKSIDVATSWYLFDDIRGSIQTQGSDAQVLFPDTNAVEDANAGQGIDFLSNGFKVRAGNGYGINNAATYFYAAWAEAPSINLYGAQSNAR